MTLSLKYSGLSMERFLPSDEALVVRFRFIGEASVLRNLSGRWWLSSGREEFSKGERTADPVVLEGCRWSFAVDLGESLGFLLMASPHREISSDLAFPFPTGEISASGHGGGLCVDSRLQQCCLWLSLGLEEKARLYTGGT
ncbi:unnamed protein product [Arabis nemorensis]|uniref:Uncharacterized protein n=1 Tax=Arabis nemorensis TaxID=586526 RepID=A0A565CLB3_9BRAS|nr:unnamed protein product [Arabis nemorensis]